MKISQRYTSYLVLPMMVWHAFCRFIKHFLCTFI